MVCFSLERGTGVNTFVRSVAGCLLGLALGAIAGEGPGILSTDGPDLSVTEATTTTTNPVLGTSFDVSWTVRNDGNEPANGQNGWWYDVVYYSATEVLDGNEIGLGYQERSGSDVPLPVGNSYVSFLTVALPGDIPTGPGWIVFVADGWGDVTESDESNNGYALPITVEMPDVDLQVLATDAPPSAQMGGDILLSWTVTNAGSDAASAQWYDAVYISGDDALSSDDVILGGSDVSWASPLPGGGSYDVSDTYPAPTHFPNGTTAYLFFATDTFIRGEMTSDHRDGFDFAGTQLESNERNNLAMRPIVLTAPDVDLVVSSATAPATLQNSGTATVSFTVRNQGAVETVGSEHYDGVYFSTDAIWNDGDYELFEYYRDSAVAAGASYSVTDQSIPIYYNIPAGPGYLLFVTDKWGMQAETNKPNNVRAVAVTVLPPDVDLTITAASAPSVAALGSSISFSWTVKNIGTVESTAYSWRDVVYLSTNMTLETEMDIIVATGGRHSRLGAGASYTITVDRSLPDDLEAGAYYLIFATDNDNEQVETSEDNNTLVRAITVAGADLRLKNANAPSEILPGMAAAFVWTVENVGAAPAGAHFDGIYLSSDAGWDVNDTLLLERLEATLLPVGESRTYTNTYGFAHTLPTNGSAYLLFVTDRRNNLNETTKTNNARALPVELKGADLHLTAATVSATTLSPGMTVDISHTVRNAGNRSAEGGAATPGTGWYDRWYLSRNTVWDSGDTRIAEYWAGDHAPLAVGAAYTSTRTLTMPAATAAGAGYLLAVTDADLLQKEAGRMPNTKAIAVTILGPDLALVTATAPAVLVPGEHVNVSWTVANQGSAAASAAFWYDSLYLSTDDQIGPGDWQYTPYIQPSAHRPLAAGAAYTNTLTFTVPARVPGNYFLIFATDRMTAGEGGVLGEENESNNAFAIALKVEAPNFTIVSVSAPSQSVANASFEVSWTVTNSGAAPAPATWSDVVYFSTTDAHLPDTQIGSASAEAFSPLAPGASYTLTNRVTLPASGAGLFYLLFNTDSADKQGESVETDNWFAHPIAIGAPDLEAISMLAPATAGAGAGVSISWEVENAGSVAAVGEWSDTLFLSTNSVYDGSAVYMHRAASSHVAPLASGDSYSNSLAAIVPNFPPGAAFWHVVVNYGEHQGETSYANNVRSQPVTITAPDLAMLNAVSPAEAVASQAIDVSWTVENAGDSSVGFPWYDGVFIAVGTNLDHTAVMLRVDFQSLRVPLAAGQRYTVNATVTLPANRIGAYHLIFAADRHATYGNNNRIAEKNENNNALARPITIGAPDLKLVSATVPGTLVLQQPMDIAYTVGNIGTVPVYGARTDAVFLSDDATHGYSDMLVGSRRMDAGEALAPGAQQSGSIRMVVPNNLGVSIGDSKHLIVLVNYGGQQGETDMSNNVRAYPVTIAGPDLALIAPSAPKTAALGQTITASWAVSNDSPVAAAASWRDGIYLSTSPDLSGTHIGVHEAQSPRPLAGDDFYERSIRFTVPNFTPGERYLVFKADARNQQAESDTGNNLAALPITLTAPNLSISNLVATPENIETGDLVLFSWRVYNTGNGAVFGSFLDRARLTGTDSNIVYATGDAFFSATGGTNTPLEPGAFIEQQTALYVPNWTSAVGGLALTVEVNADASVPEYLGTNSAMHDNLAVLNRMCTLAPYADLLATNLTAPLTAVAGTPVRVAWRVANIGGRSTAVSQIGSSGWIDSLMLLTNESFASIVPLTASAYAFYNNLEAGEFTERQNMFWIPPLVQEGDYYLALTTIGTGDFHDANPSNNRTLVPIRIEYPLTPNLRITALVVPDEPLAGSLTEVSWTVENIGETATGAGVGWMNTIYLSRSPTIDPDARWAPVVGNVANPSALEVGESYNSSATLQIPEDAEGRWYVHVMANWRETMSENGRMTNNLGVASMSVQMVPTPDLIVTSVSVPPYGFSGQDYPVTYAVRNAGAAPAPGYAIRDAIFLSLDDKYSSDDIAIGQGNGSSILATGQEYTNTVATKLPPLAEGTYHILVYTDYPMALGKAYGYIYEHAAEGNNERVAPDPVQILELAPDLEVARVDVPGELHAGAGAHIRYTLANKGTVETGSGSWTDAAWLSKEPVWNENAVLLHRESNSQNVHSSIRGGGSRDYEMQASLPFDLEEGAYYIVIHADADNRLNELDDDNNFGASESVLLLNRPVYLRVNNLVAKATVLGGSSLRVEYQVENVGSSSTVSNWEDRVYLSTMQEWGEWSIYSAILLAAINNPTNLNPGESYSISTRVHVPQYTGSGTATDQHYLEGPYYLHVLANASRTQATPDDSTEDRKSVPVTILLNTNAPDLVISEVRVQTPPAAGNYMRVSWTAVNQGIQPVEGQWNDGIWLCVPDATSPGGYRMVEYLAEFLAPVTMLATGDRYVNEALLEIPLDVVGDYHVGVFANNRLLVREWTSLNNLTVNSERYSIHPAVRPDLDLRSLQPPSSAYIGEPLVVGYTLRFDPGWYVSNIDGQVNTRSEGDWENAFYLSADTHFELRSDYFIGKVSRRLTDYQGCCVQYLGDTNRLCEDFAEMSIPTYIPEGEWYLCVKLNSRGNLPETNLVNNFMVSASPLRIRRREPVDLVAGIVTIPSNAPPGSLMELTYTVWNLGANAAEGTWHDSLFLSTAPEWTDDALLFKQVEVRLAKPVAPGQSYVQTNAVPVPALPPGDYYAILRTNIRNSIPETTGTNNVSASLSSARLTYPVLSFDTTVTGVLKQAGAVYYAVEVPAGQTLEIVTERIAVEGVSTGRTSDLLVRYELPPTIGLFDFISDTPYAVTQRVLVPETRPGTYYIMFQTQEPSGYTITARLVEFGVRSVTPSQVGNAGRATLEMHGTKLTEDTRWQLIAPDNTVIDAAAVHFEDAVLAYVTFNLANAATGGYSVRAIGPQGQLFVLTNALAVTKGTGPRLESSVRTSERIRPDPFTIFLEYANIGDADMIAPLMLLEGPENLHMGLAHGRKDAVQELEFMALSTTGPGHILRPGQRVQFNIFCDALPDGRYQLKLSSVIQETDEEAFAWDDYADGMCMPGYTPENWALLWAIVAADMGGSRNEVLESLARHAAAQPTVNGVPNILVDDQFKAAIFDAVGRGGGMTDTNRPYVVTHLPRESDTGVDAVGIIFSKTMNTDTITPDDVAIRRPDGSAIGGVAVERALGRFVWLTFPTQSAPGRYNFEIGPNIACKAEHLLDQNFDGIGGTTNDVYASAFTLDAAGRAATVLAVTDVSPNGAIAEHRGVDALYVTFSHTVLASSFTPEDMTLSGLSGAIPAFAVERVTPNIFRVVFPRQSARGAYTGTIGPNISTLSGEALQGGAHPFTFTIADRLGPCVTSHAPDWFVTNAVTSLLVTFDEPIAVATFSPAKVRIQTIAGDVVPSAIVPLSANEFRIVVPEMRTRGDVTVTIGPDIEDLHGNPMDQNRNAISGETDDAYAWTFLIPHSVAATPPAAAKRSDEPAGHRGVAPAALDPTLKQPYRVLTIAGRVSYGGILATMFPRVANVTVQLWEQDNLRDVSLGKPLPDDFRDDLVAETLTRPDGSFVFDTNRLGFPIPCVDSGSYDLPEDDDANTDGTRPPANYYVVVLAKNDSSTACQYDQKKAASEFPDLNEPWVQRFGEAKPTPSDEAAPVYTIPLGDATTIVLSPYAGTVQGEPATVNLPTIVVSDTAFMLTEFGHWVAHSLGDGGEPARPRMVYAFHTDTSVIKGRVAGYNGPLDCIEIGCDLVNTPGPTIFHEYGHALHEFYSGFNNVPYMPKQNYGMLQYTVDKSTAFSEAWASFIAARQIRQWQGSGSAPLEMDNIDNARHPKHFDEPNDYWMGWLAYEVFDWVPQKEKYAQDDSIGNNLDSILDTFRGYPKSTTRLEGEVMGGLMSIFWDLSKPGALGFDDVRDLLKENAMCGSMKLYYQAAIAKFPAHKDQIDTIFIDHGVPVVDDPYTKVGVCNLAHHVDYQTPGVGKPASELIAISMDGLIMQEQKPGGHDDFYLQWERYRNQKSLRVDVRIEFDPRYGDLAARLIYSEAPFMEEVEIQEDLRSLKRDSGGIISLSFDRTYPEPIYFKPYESYDEISINVMGHGSLVQRNMAEFENFLGDFHPNYRMSVLVTKGFRRPDSTSSPDIHHRHPRLEESVIEFVVYSATDPNDIIGPNAYGPENWIRPQPMDYKIRFANEAAAGAWAREVYITQNLDPDLDPRSFRVGDFGWSDVYIQVPTNRTFYSARLDLRETKGILADVSIGVNIETGQAFWHFLALDPQTGLPPEAVDKGLLPPEDGNGAGQGFACYTISPRDNAPAGTVLDALATIIFDTEPPLDTPPIFHTIDPSPPLATLDALYPKVEGVEIPLRWRASDPIVGSGLAGVDVYVSDNGGAETLWLENATQTEAVYIGKMGRTYRFRVVARDNVGYTTATPATETIVSGVLGPYITARRSAAEHTGLGRLTLDITPDGGFTEPRHGGLQTLLLSFSKPLAPASFTPATVSISGLSLSNSPIDLSGVTISTALTSGDAQAEITFTPALTNAARYSITLDGLTDTEARTMEFDNTLVLYAMPGDLISDRTVDTNDIAQLQSRRAEAPLNPAYPHQIRADLNRDGRINNTDLSGLYTLLDGVEPAPGPAATNGSLVLAIRSLRGTDQIERLQGETFAVDVVVSAAAAAEHTSASFQLESTPPGLLYDALLWRPAYANGTADDHSAPTPGQLPTVLTNRVRLSNLTNAGEPWQTFSTGTLATLRFTIPSNFPAGPVALHVTPDTLANVWTVLPATNAPDFTLNILEDADLDGIPDDWEIANFGRLVPADVLAANRMNTLREAYIAGISPTNPAAFLLIENVRVDGSNHIFEWQPQPGRAYNILQSHDLTGGFERTATGLTDGIYTNTAPTSSPGSFYFLEVIRWP